MSSLRFVAGKHVFSGKKVGVAEELYRPSVRDDCGIAWLCLCEMLMSDMSHFSQRLVDLEVSVIGSVPIEIGLVISSYSF